VEFEGLGGSWGGIYIRHEMVYVSGVIGAELPRCCLNLRGSALSS